MLAQSIPVLSHVVFIRLLLALYHKNISFLRKLFLMLSLKCKIESTPSYFWFQKTCCIITADICLRANSNPLHRGQCDCAQILIATQMDVSSGILHKVQLFQTIHWTMCAIVQRLQSLLAQYTCILMNIARNCEQILIAWQMPLLLFITEVTLSTMNRSKLPLRCLFISH